jgi:hypothetical protein
MPYNCTLKMVKMINFMLCIFNQNFRRQNRFTIKMSKPLTITSINIVYTVGLMDEIILISQ